MPMTVEIPFELQPLVAAAVARGRFANEQDLVADILRAAVPVLDDQGILVGELSWRMILGFLVQNL